MTPEDAGRWQRSLDVVHSMTYFAPETEQHLVAAGLTPGRMCYFAGRSAAMGAVGAGAVAATFYNFSPALVAEHIPAAWALAAPSAVVEARLAAVDAALHRMLGELADSPVVAEAAGLARAATQACRPEGRALYAAHAELAWPGEPLLDLWHAVTLLREHRGDGHVAALLGAGLSGLEALVTHTATGRGFTVEFARTSRGWTGGQWSAAEDGLRERGLLDADGGLTDAGREQRAGVEALTGRSALAPWDALGEKHADRLAEVGATLTRAVLATRPFGSGVFAAGSDRSR